jgi:hypothetical protein
MSGRQISVHRVKRLAELHDCKGPLPISHFARALSVSRATVRRYFGRIKKSGYSYAELATLRPKEIRAALKQETTQQNFPKPYMALMKVFEKTHEGLYEGSANLKKSWTQYSTLSLWQIFVHGKKPKEWKWLDVLRGTFTSAKKTRLNWRNGGARITEPIGPWQW